MDLRPQAHDIIRTWLFYTVVRAELEFGMLPFTDVAISGFVNDPDRKKMSKSAGNSQDDPFKVIADHGADALRYWAAGARPGRDLFVDYNQFKIGRRLAMKILNASRFALGFGESSEDDAVTEPVDRALLASLRSVVAETTAAFDDYDYSKALDITEASFWRFCDDYVELVKGRAYGNEGHAPASIASARRTLAVALSVQLRLFAPFMAYVTEEVWSWWQEGSVHRAAWPTVDELDTAGAGDEVETLDAAATVLSAVRRAKTEAKVGMKTPVARLEVRDTAARIAAMRSVEADLREAGVVTDLDLAEGEPSIEVTLS
jgi:valyl-tRNA synthetase